jgi:hypothetical protein
VLSLSGRAAPLIAARAAGPQSLAHLEVRQVVPERGPLEGDVGVEDEKLGVRGQAQEGLAQRQGVAHAGPTREPEDRASGDPHLEDERTLSCIIPLHALCIPWKVAMSGSV